MRRSKAPKMPKFCPMLECPLLVTKKIFEDIDPGQLFELSRLSKRLERKIKDSGVRCKKHFVSFTGQPSIWLNFTDEKRMEILFNFPYPKHVKVRFAYFDNLTFSYAQVNDQLMQVCTQEVSVFRGLYRFYDYIAGLFSTKIVGKLEVDVDKIKNLIGLLAIPEFSSCEILQLTGGKMEDEDAQYIQEHCRISDTLSLIGQVGRRDQHWKMLEVKNLSIKMNDWISLNDVILMRCENIYIEGCKISDIDLIEFVKMWVNGQTNQRLKTLTVTFAGATMFPRFIIPQPPRVIVPNPAVHAADSDSDDSDDEADNQIRLQIHMEAMRIQQLNEQNLELYRQAVDERLQEIEQTTVWNVLKRKRMDFKKHGSTFIRGEESFSKLTGQLDIIDLNLFYRDIERFDGTLASICLLNKTFTMLVWHEFELPPI